MQPRPNGLAQAFLIGESFLGGSPSALILGDNLFHGHEFPQLLARAAARRSGATVFAYHVHDLERYGVVSFDAKGRAESLEEKPRQPKSPSAVTGLYFYDEHVVERAQSLEPSARGELEITDLNRLYLEKSELHVEVMGRGYSWLDTGTHESLLDASQFISVLERRQGLKLACLEEVAFRQGWITAEELRTLVEKYRNNEYGRYLQRTLSEVGYT